MEISIDGFLLVIVRGIMMGSFALLMKFTPEWKWGNPWFIYYLSSLLVVGEGLHPYQTKIGLEFSVGIG